MAPWSYKELQHCKSILYPGEETLPTTLMDRLFNWYGGVPRYVLDFASSKYKATGSNEEAVFQKLHKIITDAMSQGSMADILNAHKHIRRGGEYSHRVLHICRHPSGRLDQFHLAWASQETTSVAIYVNLYPSNAL
ncbi:hypothetical protein PSTG_02683 [Puccinia striiformis f. sp. tritici PST-78]|uniref:Uncharacterized protein n=1 Tax=Puccinia striiformis f. sp. tritici PST-78 TaxID=1165861 RepID=A0A0L0VZ97_9BASI|nr:hypothetical protein PSTG_02683 [Puccinia striiformis f. sp. tritici PST-78]